MRDKQKPRRTIGPATLLLTSLAVGASSSGCATRAASDPTHGGGAPAGVGRTTAETCLQKLHRVAVLVRAEGDAPKRSAAILAALRELVHAATDPSQQQDKGEQSCADGTETLVRHVAGRWASRAITDDSVEDLASTLALYDLYLKAFPRGHAAYRFAHYRAKVLFRMRRWGEAGEAFDELRQRRPGKDDTDQSLLAAHNAVASWRKIMSTSKRAARRLAAAIDAFLTLAPRTPERGSLLFLRARMHYEQKAYAEAARVCALIVTELPRHELASRAAKLLLDSLHRASDETQLEAWVERLLAIKPLAQGELLELLEKLRLNLGRSAGERLARQGRYRACGETYERLAGLAKQRVKRTRRQVAQPEPQWSTMIYNGAVCFEQAGLAEKALALRRQLVLLAPRDPLAGQVLDHVCRTRAGKRDPWWRGRCRGRGRSAP